MNLPQIEYFINCLTKSSQKSQVHISFMNFALNQNCAIVWFSKSDLQLAFTIDDSVKPNEPHSKNYSNKIYPIKLDQFNPHNSNQHFTFHPVNENNCFIESFIAIESLSHKGYFLDIIEKENKEKKLCLSKNAKNWQFYDGHFRCNNGEILLSIDSQNYRFNFIDKTKLLKENISNQTVYSQIQYYDESTFHLCFYNGNSIPKHVPIIFYSPLYKGVITIITDSDLNAGGHWLRMLKFDPHKSSQVWFFGAKDQDVIVNSILLEQAFDYYNDNSHYLLYTHYQHGHPNQCWDYQNYKLITRQADRLIVEYDNLLQEFKMREDKTFQNEPDTNSPNVNWDYFSKPNTFLIFMSNQRNLTNFQHDLDLFYLENCFVYEPLSERTLMSFNEIRRDSRETLDISFKDTNESITAYISNAPMRVIRNRDTLGIFDIVNNLRDLFKHDKLSITSDQRIMISNCVFNENCTISFSLLATDDSIRAYLEKDPNMNPVQNMPMHRRHRPYVMRNFPNPFLFRGYQNQIADAKGFQPIREMMPPYVKSNSFKSIIPKKSDIDLKSEFQHLFSGKTIDVSPANSEYCRHIGEKYHIHGLIEVANFVDSFSAQYSRLSELSEIQDDLYDINCENISNLAVSFEEYLKTFGSDIIEYIILSVYSCMPLQRENLHQFVDLLTQKCPEFHNPLANLKDETSYYSKRYFNKLSDEKINLQSETEMVNCITDDNIEQFQKIFSSLTSPKNLRIESSSIPFLESRPTYIQYAAYMGSIKIFKYLFLQKFEKDETDTYRRSLFQYALVGGNSEIVHIVHQQMLSQNQKIDISTDILQTLIQHGRNQILQWVLDNFKLEGIDYKLVLLETVKAKNIGAFLSFISYIEYADSQIVRLLALFDNLEMLKLLNCFWFHNKECLICDAAVNGNVNMMKYLLSSNILDENLRKLAVTIAIKLDNLDLFHFLRCKKDLSYENFLFAAFYQSTSILSFISETINFANIVFEGDSLLVRLIKERKERSFDILLHSKYINNISSKEIGKLFENAIFHHNFPISDDLHNFNPYSCNINNIKIVNAALKDESLFEYILKFSELNCNAFLKNKPTLISFIAVLKNQSIPMKMLKKPELFSGSFYELIKVSIVREWRMVFDYLIKSDLIEIKYAFQNHLNELVEICLKNPKHEFALEPIIKTFSIDKNSLKQLCFKSPSETLLNYFLDEFTEDEMLRLFISALKHNTVKLDFFIENATKFGALNINQIDVENGKNPMTYLISNNELNILNIKYINSIIDINEVDKNGFSPFMELLKVCDQITSQNKTTNDYFLNNNCLILHDYDLKYAIKLKHISGISYILSNLNLYVDDPIELIKLIVNLNNSKFIKLIGEYIKNDAQNRFLYPSLLLIQFRKFKYSQYIDYIFNEHMKIDEVSIQMFSIYDCKMIYYSQIKKMIKFGHDLNGSTYFGNVGDIEIASDLYQLMNDRKTPNEIKVQEITGFNLNGETCLYRSIVDNNLSLFSFILKIATENGIVGKLITMPNRNSNTVMDAISNNENWKLFLNPLLEIIQQLKIDIFDDSNVTDNVELFEFLFENKILKSEFLILNLILKLKLWTKYEEIIYKDYPNFKLNMYMPIENIPDQKSVEKLFIENRIDFNAHIDSDYLLISAIKNNNAELALFLIKSDYPIVYDSQDTLQKTALHYAIENSMDEIVSILINRFCSKELFKCLLIEDQNKETPIHYIFKSFNAQYATNLYSHLKKYLNNDDELKSMINSIRIKPIQHQDELVEQTILTNAIVNEEIEFVRFLLTTIIELDVNMPNSINQTPLYLSFDHFNILYFILSLDMQHNQFDLNNDAIFKIFEISSPIYCNDCLKAIFQHKSFDINLKNTKTGMCFGDYLAQNKNQSEVWSIYLKHPQLKMNWRPDSIKYIIENDFHRYASYSLVFSRFTDDEIQNYRTDDESKDTIATLAAKNGNYFAIAGLIKDHRIDFQKQIDADQKSFIDIINESDKFDDDLIDSLMHNVLGNISK